MKIKNKCLSSSAGNYLTDFLNPYTDTLQTNSLNKCLITDMSMQNVILVMQLTLSKL